MICFTERDQSRFEMTKIEWMIPVGSESVSAVYEGPTARGERQVVFACAHGAGGNKMDRGVLATANALRLSDGTIAEVSAQL